MMNPTAKQFEELAKIIQLGSTGYDHDWEDHCLDNSAETTRDTLADFRTAAKNWRESSGVQEINGGLFWKKVQTFAGQQRVSFAVIDCGEFRLCVSQ